MTSKSMKWLGAIAMCGLVSVVAGCGSGYQNYEEVILGSSADSAGGLFSPEAPEWVKGAVTQDAENLYIVGRAVGYNSLDEQGAFDAAQDNALVQLAKHIATWVTITGKRSDTRSFSMSSGVCVIPPSLSGNRFLPGEHADQKITQCVQTTTEALAGDVETREVYWEKIELREVPERLCRNSLRMKRYKCWVLMSVPRDKVESRVQATLAALQYEESKRSGRVFAVRPSHTGEGDASADRLAPRGAAYLYAGN